MCSILGRQWIVFMDSYGFGSAIIFPDSVLKIYEFTMSTIKVNIFHFHLFSQHTPPSGIPTLYRNDYARLNQELI